MKHSAHAAIRSRHWRGAVVLVLGFLAAGLPAQAEPINLVASGKVDLEAGVVTLPLKQGRMSDGAAAWYVLLDASDRAAAARLGINWSAKLANAADAARDASVGPDGSWVFAVGTVDFAPERRVVPGPTGQAFPPAIAQPGSVADADYSPLVRPGDGVVYNAPVVASGVPASVLDRFCDGAPDHGVVHDKVTRICPRDGTVTLALTAGFARGKRIEYVSTEASVALVAALEGATFAPRLAELPADLDDAPDSAVEPIYVVINGETGDANPSRQGLESALADGLQPLNVTGDIPTLGDGYSPLWASHPVNWADTSLDRRWRITSEADVRGLAGLRLVHGPGGRAIGADGILVNCPAIARRD